MRSTEYWSACWAALILVLVLVSRPASSLDRQVDAQAGRACQSEPYIRALSKPLAAPCVNSGQPFRSAKASSWDDRPNAPANRTAQHDTGQLAPDSGESPFSRAAKHRGAEAARIAARVRPHLPGAAPFGR